jgi:phenylacetate-CoA ligase
VIKKRNNEQLKIRAELAQGVEPTPQLADKLASKMEFATGVPCEFEFVTKLARPGVKTVRVVQEEGE